MYARRREVGEAKKCGQIMQDLVCSEFPFHLEAYLDGIIETQIMEMKLFPWVQKKRLQGQFFDFNLDTLRLHLCDPLLYGQAGSRSPQLVL